MTRTNAVGTLAPLVMAVCVIWLVGCAAHTPTETQATRTPLNPVATTTAPTFRNPNELPDDPASHAIIRLWPGDPPATQPFNKPEAGETFIANDGDPHHFSVKAVNRAWLVEFLPEHPSPSRTAIILCTGGGYGYESIYNEGVTVARRMSGDGIATFILKYRLPNGHFPTGGDQLPLPQQDVLRAVQLVRANAAEWNIDPHRIGVVGFSAGGHTAATAATLYGEADKLKAIADDAVSIQSARPDFAGLIYPVISIDPKVGKSLTRPNLVGPHASDAVVQHLSADRHVTGDTPPLFITAAIDDKTITYHQSELMALAAERSKIEMKFVLIETGGHGFSIGVQKKPETFLWYPLFLQWLQRLEMWSPSVRD